MNAQGAVGELAVRDGQSVLLASNPVFQKQMFAVVVDVHECRKAGNHGESNDSRSTPAGMNCGETCVGEENECE